MVEQIFRTMGRSGLIVSPLALGTMTFGTPRWGSPDDVSKAIFDTYVDAGGNFIDTADVYAGGKCEELLAKYIGERKLRDRIVLSTKYTFSAEAGNPNAGGNGRKNLFRALEGSLRRLRTDYVDLYWTHFWDQLTPLEEVLESLGDLQRAGKVRYFGFSNVPAWYAMKAATLAADYRLPGPVALQEEYSLAERSIEREHLPAAQESGLGMVCWGPLSSGFLTGKYSREDQEAKGTGRFASRKHFRTFTDRNWETLKSLRSLAESTGKSLSQIALAWASRQPGITSLLLGASTVEQLTDNLASREVNLSAQQWTVLDEASQLEPVHPYLGFNPDVRRSIFGGVDVQRRP